MKILFVIKTLNHSHGGAERVLTQIAGSLAENGHHISILTFDKPEGKSFYKLSQKIRRIDLPIGNAEKHSTIFEILPRIKEIRSTAKKEKPDIVIAFMHSTFIPASIGLIGTGIPLIASEHIVPDHYRNRGLEYLLFMTCSPFIKKITVVSEKIRQAYPQFLHKKMAALPNPVSVPDNPLTSTEPKNTILNVGRLDPQKDQETLIRAFAEIAPDIPGWNLRIIGEGELRDKLETLISELNMKDRIALPGLTQDINSEYASAKIFVMPSRYEAFGLATAEAMSFGLPAIGFADCPGTNEIIQDGINGLLISSENRTNTLANSIKTLTEDESLRKKLGEGGKKSLTPYKLSNITTLWERLIQETVKKP